MKRHLPWLVCCLVGCPGGGRQDTDLTGIDGTEGGDGTGGLDALPSVSIDTPAGPLLGDSDIALHYAVVPGSRELAAATLVFAYDGGPEVAVQSLAIDQTSAIWHAPPVDTSAAHLAVVVAFVDGGDPVRAATADFAIDATVPAVTLAPIGTLFDGGFSVPISWTANDTWLVPDSVVLQWSPDGMEWTTLDENLPASGMFPWTLPSIVVPGARVRVSARDLAGHTGSADSTLFGIDAEAPVPLLSMLVNGAAAPPPTINRIALVSLTAEDAVTPFSAFCLKRSQSSAQPAAPIENDPCWVPLDAPYLGLVPSPSLALADFPFSLGFLPGTVHVFAWVKDALGRISVNTGASGVDRVAIAFDPGEPPELDEVFATTSDNPSSPLSNADLTIAATESLFVKWRAVAQADKPEALPLRVRIDYTTDDVSYTLVKEELENAQGAGCTAVGPKTGCYLWSGTTLPRPQSPTYFRVRVTVTDARGLTTVRSTTPPLNVSTTIGFLAGNPDPGLTGNARAAVLNNGQTQSFGEYDPGSFVVSSRGVVYFRDRTQGVLWVNPQNGNVEMLLRKTGATTGEQLGTAAISATARDPVRIIIDFHDRLIVWDYDRLRRIEVDGNGFPTIIETIAQDLPPCVNGYQCAFVALPNDDIYFPTLIAGRPSMGYGFRRLRGDTAAIEDIALVGNGFSRDPDVPIDSCIMHNPHYVFTPFGSTLDRIVTHVYATADPSDACRDGFGYGFFTFDANGQTTTPYIDIPGLDNGGWMPYTGMDGKLYSHVSNGAHGVFRLDLPSNTWTRVLGDGVFERSNCDPGIDALACRTELQDVFVDVFGRLYWMAFGRLRTLDDDNKVVELIGQPLDYGDGTDALNARLPFINQIGIWRDGSTDKVVVADPVNVRYREAAVGGTMETIAGTGVLGSLDPGLPPTDSPAFVMSYTTFAVGPSGDVFIPAVTDTLGAAKLYKIDRGPDTWQAIAGGGATPYAVAADNTLGSNIAFTRTLPGPQTVVIYRDDVFGVVNGRVTRYFSGYNNSVGWWDGMIKSFDVNTGSILHIAGVDGASTNVACAAGSATATCRIPVASGQVAGNQTYDDFNGRWLLPRQSWPYRVIRAFNPPNGNVEDIATLPMDFKSIAYRRVGGDDVLYYCAASDGLIRRFVIGAASQDNNPLAWPVASMRCAGNRMFYYAARNSLVFPYEQFGLHGVAELINPP